jgi:hypothetical protein
LEGRRVGWNIPGTSAILEVTFAIPAKAAAAGGSNTGRRPDHNDFLGVIMAKRHYTADSAFLLPFSPMLCVPSDVTGGCAFVPGVGHMADGISLSTITPSIG